MSTFETQNIKIKSDSRYWYSNNKGPNNTFFSMEQIEQFDSFATTSRLLPLSMILQTQKCHRNAY